MIQWSPWPSLPHQDEGPNNGNTVKMLSHLIHPSHMICVFLQKIPNGNFPWQVRWTAGGEDVARPLLCETTIQVPAPSFDWLGGEVTDTKNLRLSCRKIMVNLFSPRKLGKMNPIWRSHIFQMGWWKTTKLVVKGKWKNSVQTGCPKQIRLGNGRYGASWWLMGEE